MNRGSQDGVVSMFPLPHQTDCAQSLSLPLSHVQDMEEDLKPTSQDHHRGLNLTTCHPDRDGLPWDRDLTRPTAPSTTPWGIRGTAS